MSFYAYPNIGRKNFIGCGRFIAHRLTKDIDIDQNDEILSPDTETNVQNIYKTLINLIPKYHSYSEPLYEIRDRPERSYHGSSMDLAYLLVMISCEWNPRSSPNDCIWCTGQISKSNYLDHVSFSEFPIKLEAFLSKKNRDKLFIIPAAHVKQVFTSSVYKNINVFHLHEIGSTTLKDILTSDKKTILTVHWDGLEELLNFLFDKPDTQLVIQNYKITKFIDKIKLDNNIRYSKMEVLHDNDRVKIKRLAKCYCLTDVPEKYHNLFDETSIRHARVALGIRHLNINIVHDIIKESDNIWIIEDLINGKKLSDLIAKRQCDEMNLKKIMYSIGEGLQALHENNMIRRALTPDTIIIESQNQNAILTDFELVKIFDGNPTVVDSDGTFSNQNLYIAPELFTNPHTNDLKVDIYSWGSIFFHCVTGYPYKDINSELSLKESKLPKKIIKLIMKCLAFPENRPKNMNIVLKQLSKWRI